MPQDSIPRRPFGRHDAQISVLAGDVTGVIAEEPSNRLRMLPHHFLFDTVDGDIGRAQHGYPSAPEFPV
jgi:hypothetical protein